MMEHRCRGHEWCNLCVGVGIDGPGGAVDGARGEVNDAHMFQGALRPRTCECGDAICQQGLHLLWVCCLAILQYGKSESSHVGMGAHVGMGCGCGVCACACIRGLCMRCPINLPNLLFYHRVKHGHLVCYKTNKVVSQKTVP